uniref:myomesin-1-like n=1 Tax=Myxine glutinosa TaxID=7769 RepID=UPI00358E04B2
MNHKPNALLHSGHHATQTIGLDFPLAIGDTDTWQRINTDKAVKSPRLAVFDLAEGKSYRFRVLAANSAGESSPSDPSGSFTPDKALSVPSAPSSLMGTRNTKTSLALNWHPPKSMPGLIGYYLEQCRLGTNQWEPSNNKPVKDTRFAVHGLETGEKYIFRTRAVNAAGLSEYSPESDPVTVLAPIVAPSTPFNITLLQAFKDAMMLSWRPPRSTGGSPITGYYVDFVQVAGDGTLMGEWEEANIKAVGDRMYKVHEMKEGTQYKFRIRAGNIAGVGSTSDASDTFTCEEWKFPEPGPPYDVTYTEVRNDSVVVLWKPPVYIGETPVSGYHVEMTDEPCLGQWKRVTTKSIDKKYFKVTGLQEGNTYRFRICAENQSGTGWPSLPSEPVKAVTPAGSHDVKLNVDDEGNIFLQLECPNATPDSECYWFKSYDELPATSHLTSENKDNVAKLCFNNATLDDAGQYSCTVTDTDGVSASYNLSEEELKDAMEKSNKIKHPTIPLKSDLAVELQEKGRVRFFMHVKPLSPNSDMKFIVNEKDVTDDKKYQVHIDKANGVIEVFMDSLTPEDEGTYTVQLHDGLASAQSSLVLIGDAFKELLKDAENQRKEWLRKQGPHFIEYLSWSVTEQCCVELLSKVANLKKETNVIWYKDEKNIMAEAKHEMKDGVCSLLMAEFSKKDAGMYKLEVVDDRGRDTSVQELSGKVMDEVVHALCKACALSASPLQVKSSADGIKVFSNLKHYIDELKYTWFHNDNKMVSSEKYHMGESGGQIWLQLTEPEKKDMGKYILEMFDGEEKHKLYLDFTGQEFDEAFEDYRRLKEAAIADTKRARVVGGLPDVVTIMEGKSLKMTCSVVGEPLPEVTWMKNERALVADGQRITLQMEGNRYGIMTIRQITTEDSGTYSVLVQNTFGSDHVEFTVSVYKQGQEPPAVPRPKK